MAELTVVPENDPPYNAAADSLGSWADGVAFLRLEHLIGRGFETYIAAQREKPELTVRRHLAMEIARAHPGILDSIRGSK